MEKFVALSLSGVSLGAVLAVTALGFLLLYKASGVINFAHGDLMTLGAYIALWFVQDIGFASPLAYVAALGVMFFVGVALERVAHLPLRRHSHLTVIIATLAASIAIRGAVAYWQGSDPKSLPSPVDGAVVEVLGASVSAQRLLVIGIGAAAIGALIFVFDRTSLGRQLRALAEDPETARLQGVRADRLAMLVFGASASLATLAGVLVAPLTALDLTFGFSLMVLAFAAAVVGGFGSLRGAVAAAMAIGVLQQLLGGYVLQDYASTFPFVLMFLVIVVRPTGLVAVGRTRL